VAFDLIAIGASLGGLHALGTLLAMLPASFAVPLVLVQHRHKDSDETLRLALQQHSALPIYEAQDKQPIVGGAAYLAPADYHLLVEPGSFALSTEGPVLYARPSIDVLLESAAVAYRERLIGVVLTGASADGAQGSAAIKAHGGCVIVQEPATAECRVMPEAALGSVTPDYVLPLEGIALMLIQLCRNGHTGVV
jgi:two-component system, chemotaxis family, protein-glutamate methylesterase/glutaminase